MLIAVERGIRLSERERTAFDLFTAAQSIERSLDARFAMLFAAIESLLEPVECPKAVMDHIDTLMALTKSTDLDSFERDSILNAMHFMKQKSIRRNGRELVTKTLPGREYGGIPPEAYFLECYDMRNRLLHGAQPYPTREEVGKLVGGLTQMVGDLISRSYVISKNRARVTILSEPNDARERTF